MSGATICNIHLDESKARAPIVALNEGPRTDLWFRGLLISD